MSSNSGITDGQFDRIVLNNDLAVGEDADFGTNGQVLISGGENEPLRWGSNTTSAPNPLRQGTNLQIVRTSDASNLGSYDGSIDATISSTDTTYQADLGVEINTATSPDTIQAKVDSSTLPTLRNDLNSDELAVLRVPNNLTTNLGLEYQSGITTYDGSAQTTIITKVDDTNPSTQTISNSGGTGFDELNVVRVPNTLTINDSAGTSVVFDGSSTQSITINDNDTTYVADKGVEIDLSTNPDTIKAKVDDTTPATQTISNSGGTGSDELNVIRVPNTLTITDSGGNSVVFDGSTPKSITINDDDTTYQADLGVEINTGTTPHTIQAKVDSSAQPTLRNDLNSNELAVLRVPDALLVNLGLEYQSGTDFDGSDTRTMVAKVDDTTPATQTIINNGGTGFDELSVIRVPNKLEADNSTIKIDGNLQGTYDGSGSNKTIEVVKVPNTLTIINGNTTIVFDGSSPQNLSIAQGSIDHTQVSRIGNESGLKFYQFPFSTLFPSLTAGDYKPVPNFGIENLTAVSTSYLIEISIQIFSPGATDTSSGTFCRGSLRLDKSVATTSTSAWGNANGVYGIVYLGGVKRVGGTYTFSLTGSSADLYYNGRLHYTWVITGLTLGDSYNFIPKGTSEHNTTNIKTAFTLAYGGTFGQSTISAVPIGINSPSLNVPAPEPEPEPAGEDY